MERIDEDACAKVNLTLEVRGRRPDGYHALVSLVAFAKDAFDRLTFEPHVRPSAAPDADITLKTTGAEAAEIDGPNLITRTAERLHAENPSLVLGAFHLDKRLPVASGIGGGSADAAAAIRAIARANGIRDPEAAFSAIALQIGADIPVCIGSAHGSAHGGAGDVHENVRLSDGRRPAIRPEAAFMSGIGERVWRPRGQGLLPPGGLAAVLVNPRVPVPTGAVFKALAAPLLRGEPSPELITGSALNRDFPNAEACIAYVASSRNDLEPVAIRIAPVIAEVLATLRADEACRLARMSGSGATCFALFGDMDEAHAATGRLRARHPTWWTVATRLN